MKASCPVKMSNQIASEGPGVFQEEHRDDTWVPIRSVNNASRKMYIGQVRVAENAVHVETPVTISVMEAGKSYNVNTVNHCIFCLRRTTANPETISNYFAKAEQLEEVPGAPPEYTTSAAASLLLALNKTWSHLQKGGYWDWHDDHGNAQQPFTKFTFTSVPKICLYCAAEFSRISDLMSQLKKEINKLGVIIRESKKGGAYSWRAELFERTLKGSGVGRDCISDTLKFLGIPQQNQSSCSQPASYDTFGDTDTIFPSVNITETLLSEQPKEEETSQGHLDFHDEGSEDDANIEYNDEDTNDDPNYVKEEDAFSHSEDSESPTADFDDDPLDDSKSELEQSSLQQQPNNVCSICLKTFINENGVRLHIKNFHSKGKVAKFRCDLCKIQLPCKNLYEHVHAHVGEEYLIRCPNPNTGQCSFVCCTFRGLQYHLRKKACRTATPNVNEKYLKPPDAFICQVCGHDMGNSRSLRIHLNDWHEKEGRKDFPCPIQGCPKRFNYRQSVLLHIPCHVSELNSCDGQPCDVCQKIVKFEEMKQHLKDTHHLGQETIINCFQCQFLFSDRKNLVDHLYEHRGIALFCDICGNPDTTFNQYNDLCRHYFEVHQIGCKFLCQHCECEFFSARCLKRHLAERHPAAEVPPEEKPSKDLSGGCSSSAVASLDAFIAEKIFKCDECDVVYKTKQMLTFHKITIHEGKLLPCKYCNQTFTNIGTKYSHERKHRRGSKKEMFPCQVPGCGKQFSAKATLMRHIACAHEGQKSHVCDQCGKAYGLKSGLRFHVQSVHMGVRNHVCDVCRSSFSSRTHLKRHKLIHTGDRPFACQRCGQKFRQAEGLKKHVEGHERKGAEFKPNGPRKQARKRVALKRNTKKS